MNNETQRLMEALIIEQEIPESEIYKRFWNIDGCKEYAKQLRDKTRANTAEHAAEAIEFLLAECDAAIKAAQYMTDEDDDTQGFEPDWANFQEGRKVGRAEAFERIADKIKSLPWENDTKDSFLIWLEKQK